MPNCFTLTRKGQTEPSKFSDIDNEICAHLNVPSDPVRYVYGWYNTIGIGLAMGLDWDALRKWWPKDDPEYADSPAHTIIDFLEAHYVSDAWAEIGRRA